MYLATIGVVDLMILSDKDQAVMDLVSMFDVSLVNLVVLSNVDLRVVCLQGLSHIDPATSWALITACDLCGLCKL